MPERAAAALDHLLLVQKSDNVAFRISAIHRVLDHADPATGVMPSDHFGLRMLMLPISREGPADQSGEARPGCS